jgi:rhamnosyltransferase
MTSIIIPTLNAGKQLQELLKALRSQTVPCEIIVVDSSSSDDTGEIAKHFGIQIIRIKRREFDHGGSRTFGAKMSKGDIVVYLTQDVLPVDTRAIENLIKPLGDERVGAAFGRQAPQQGATAFGAHLRLFNYPERSSMKSLSDKDRYGIKTPFLSNSFAAYRKRALEKIGGFHEDLILGEDMCAGAKLLLAGYTIAYAADAVVSHSHNFAAFQEFKRYFDIGVFHKKERWILEEFGGAGGEGLKYVRSEIAYLLKNGKYHLLPESLLRNWLKFAGYYLGGNHEKMPLRLIKKMSMHRDWWEKAHGKKKGLNL